MFKTSVRIHFREADPAGILFFGNILGLTHDVFEQFIEAAGFKYSDWFERQDIIVPIRHSEVDFLAPFKPGYSYDVTASVVKISDSSFQVKYTYSSANGPHATVSMVHTYLNGKTKQKIQIPDGDRKRLEAFYTQ